MDSNVNATDAPVPDDEAVTRADLTEAVRATALLADLTISLWSGERTDRKVGDKIKEDAGAIGNTGKYIKNLLAGCDTELKDVKAAYMAARAAHYELTLPWVSKPLTSLQRQQGPRLLPNMLFDKYLTEMSKLRRTAIGKRDNFVLMYPDLVLRAQANLAGMAAPEDYPDQEEIRESFKLSFDFLPIPSAGAFQGLPDGMLERLGKQLKARQLSAVHTAQADMWDRVKDVVGKMIERLDDPTATFKVNTIDNVRELVTLLPGFNCAGDDRVNTVVSDIDRMLDGITPKMLRQSQEARADVARQAKAINNKLAQWGL